jgi:hypothetical protein
VSRLSDNTRVIGESNLVATVIGKDGRSNSFEKGGIAGGFADVVENTIENFRCHLR